MRPALLIVLCGAAVAASGAVATGGAEVYIDPAGDAVARPTDAGQTGAFPMALPDLLELTVSAWTTPTPETNPYDGAAADADEPDLFRIDLVFDGLINPPGPLGLGAASWDPFRFGDAPVFGSVELNVDRDRDTGGELGDTALNRYLANVGRFGKRTDDSISERMALSGFDLDQVLATGPQYERSGAEFDFGFCGCTDITLVSQTGDMNGVMDAGETFIVRGRFFRRVAAFAPVSGMEGGSFGGLYDPLVEVRFSHDAVSDRTSVAFVGAMTMAGAAQLTGEPEQIADFLVDNHWSVYEACFDIIDGAEGFNGPIPADVETLISGWAGDYPDEARDPTRWRVLALFGTTYLAQQEALYIWTDTGFDETLGDFTGDAVVDSLDEAALQNRIAAFDGTAMDADGVADGSYAVVDPGPNFDAFDLNLDEVVGPLDFGVVSGSPADLTGDGVVDAADLAALIAAWGQVGPADLDGSGAVGASDLAALIAAWG